MKRVSLIILALVLVFSLTACDGIEWEEDTYKGITFDIDESLTESDDYAFDLVTYSELYEDDSIDFEISVADYTGYGDDLKEVAELSMVLDTNTSAVEEDTSEWSSGEFEGYMIEGTYKYEDEEYSSTYYAKAVYFKHEGIIYKIEMAVIEEGNAERAEKIFDKVLKSLKPNPDYDPEAEEDTEHDHGAESDGTEGSDDTDIVEGTEDSDDAEGTDR